MKFKPVPAISCAALLIAMSGLLAFVTPKQDDPLNQLVTALQKWTEASPQEKVYLHTDKPYYAVGDTIWFKGYVTTGSRHQLSAISGALYVDLIDERDSIIRALKLPLTAGMAIGDLTLGDELKQGNYHIRAYTQWMRNAGSEYFFDKTFTVGSVFSNDIVTKAGYQYKDVDGKQVLTATLNYTDDRDQPLVNKSVQYRIMVNNNLMLIKNARTDMMGNIRVNIANEKNSDFSGAYIRTVLSNSKGKDVTKDFPIKANLAQSDVQFFPESGNLVNGVVSRIGFKALGVDGLGIDISGKIIDNEGKEIAELTTFHAGMGSFFLKPEANKTYTAKINFSDGSTKSLNLPKANDDGYVLSIFQPVKDSILVRVCTRQISQPTGLNLVAQTGGEIITAQPIKIERAMTSFWLDRRAFPSGIVQFTLFDQNNQPLNERIAFIRSKDQQQLNVKLNKNSYQSREQVTAELEAVDSEGKPAIGNYSVSVIDESKLPSDEVNENSIFSSLLLSSDIKGYIEKPNYYFTNITNDVNRALDNLMLTQGYRKFAWKDLAAANPNVNNKTIKYPAEGVGINITGQVQTLGNKPYANATVTLLSLRAKITQFATTDADGRFKFNGIVVKDSVKFTVQSRTTKNTDKLKLILDSIPAQLAGKNPNAADMVTNVNDVLKAYIDAGKKQDELYEKMGRMDQVHRLRQVNIKAAKDKKAPVAFQWGLKIPEGHADRTLIIKEEVMERHGSLGMYFAAGVIPNVICIPFKGVPEALFMGGLVPMRVILNGILLSPEEAAGCFDNSYLECTDIVKIDAVITNRALKTMLGVGDNPVLVIYTKPIQNRTQYNPNIANVTPKGFNKAREFYLPKYDKPEVHAKVPDTRSTIYWNPRLKTGADGKISFSFYNADDPATYRVIVEGINAEGQLGRQVFRYKIENAL